MYYPKEYLDINKTPYLKNIFEEQCTNSSHLYLKENHIIKAGDVIVDAGVVKEILRLNILILHKNLFDRDGQTVV